MAERFINTDADGNVIIEEAKKGLNPGMIVLLIVGTVLILFLVGNYALYTYAQRTLPPKKKKPVSKKKIKRERLRQGVAPPGE
ncbi:DNA-binding protein S1FA2 [Rhynchospora pubera]|uniref:DNA-binding protein S1FA2 n=1 Tax=Rhynchospora pubera TaxID=906938 RepID=A0AAV8FRR8_9POAL|nr:DNA-binding protein S1FA2 [Rhynchospora pubera]